MLRLAVKSNNEQTKIVVNKEAILSNILIKEPQISMKQQDKQSNKYLNSDLQNLRKRLTIEVQLRNK